MGAGALEVSLFLTRGNKTVPRRVDPLLPVPSLPPVAGSRPKRLAAPLHRLHGGRFLPLQTK
jgi:hypothetical protein